MTHGTLLQLGLIFSSGALALLLSERVLLPLLTPKPRRQAGLEGPASRGSLPPTGYGLSEEDQELGEERGFDHDGV